MSPPVPQPHELLDDGFAPDPCDLLVIGCGSILRGDDAVGPVLIRHLHARGYPDGVRIVDGGTSGMDVAFGMRGAARVVIVDASTTGAEPGTVYRVPAGELADLPPIDGLHTHNFRWDHALAFSAWLLGPLRPTDVTVFLVEAGQLEPGSELSGPVAAGMQTVIDLLERDFYPTPPPALQVEITAAGYVHVPAALASERFPADVCVARTEGTDLLLVPLADAAHGGMVLSQRNRAGDRSLLVSEVFSFEPVVGVFPVTWDAEHGTLRVLLDRVPDQREVTDVDRGADGGGARVGAVGGLPAGHEPGGHRPAPPADLPHRAARTTGGGGRTPVRGAATPTTGGPS